jgi:hypothetical protein
MSATDINPNDFLLAGGVPSAKFPSIGTAVKGTIEHLEVTQQRDFTTGEPKFYDDGKPANQLVVTLSTDERDPEVTDDDGTRRLFVRGQMLAAVRSAVRAAKSQLLVGGTLAVKYVSDKPAEKRGMNPAKQYEAAYRPPVAGQSDVDDLIGGGAAAGPSASELI